MVGNNLLLAGHQPNFFPWFGYFEKIITSDVFVFSDDVQFPKRCYVNRVEVKIDNTDKYITVPVDNSNSYEIINKKKYIKNIKEFDKFRKTMYFNFKKYEFFYDLEEILEKYKEVYFSNDFISNLNIEMIKYICEKLNIQTSFYRGVELSLEQYHLNERIIKRCEMLNIYNYLAGEGSRNYHDEELFKENKINLVYMDYKLTKSLFKEQDIKYSILYLVAKYGIQYIKDGIKGVHNENIIH